MRLRIGPRVVIAAIMLLQLFLPLMAGDLIVVASQETLTAAQEWVDFLTLNEVPLKHVTPKEFEKFRKERVVVIMGGLDEEDGIRALAEEVLTESEFKDISQTGKGKMYFKFTVWDPMQTVIVIAGSDGPATEKARVDNKKDWWNTFITWFELDVEMEDSFHVY